MCRIASLLRNSTHYVTGISNISDNGLVLSLHKFSISVHPTHERWCTMKFKSNSEIKTTPNGQPACLYDDGNIPDVDLPNGEDVVKPAEPLPESERPRKDGPGGD